MPFYGRMQGKNKILIYTDIMKLKNLFACAVAFVMVLAGCEQERDFVLPKLKLGASEITFSMYGGDTTLMVEATRDWTVNIDEETAKWLVISPSSGKASATPEEVIVAVLANEGYGREATVSFSTGIQTRDLTVKQDGGLGAPAVTDGDGTKANPYSASKAQEVAAALGQDDKVTGVYAKGIVKSVKEISTDFGNATYYLTDEAGKADFYVYRGRGLGNAKFTSADELKAGDKVVIYGDLMNYMGNSPQFAQGNYIVELNGVANDPNGNDTPGGGTSDGSAIYSNNFDKTAAAEVEGQGWPFPDKSDVWKNEAGSGVSNVTYASSNVTVRNNANSDGTYSDYAGSGVNNLFFGKTPAYFAVKSIALGSTTSLELTFGTEKYSQTNGSVFTNSEFHIWLSNDGSKWVELTDYVFAGGTTEGRWNLAKANFSVPAGTANLSICLSVDAASSYRVDDLKLVASTTAGTAVDFSAAVEKDFNSGATAGGGNTGGGNTGGDNTGGDNTGGETPDVPVVPGETVVVTVAQFLTATDNTLEYQVSGTISGIYQAYNSEYNNISLYISDGTGEMLAFRLSCEGISDPANTLTRGDLITVKGKRTLYNDTTPQMDQGGVIVKHTDVEVEVPAGAKTISFSDVANRTTLTTSQQVWEQNGIKVINDKGSSTSNVADYSAPARFYKSSTLTVQCPGMKKIEFICNSGDYATALKESITSGTATVSSSVVTVDLGSAADSYVIGTLSAQVRMDSITVYTE